MYEFGMLDELLPDFSSGNNIYHAAILTEISDQENQKL